MSDLVPFSILFVAMAAASFALGRFFPACLLQKAIRWVMYAVGFLLLGVVAYAWLMASILRSG